MREVLLDPDNRMLDLDLSNHRLRRFGADTPRRFAGFYAAPTPASNATTYALSSIAAYSHDYGIGVGAQFRSVLPNDRGTVQVGLTLWPQVLADENRGFDSESLPLIPPSDDPFPPVVPSPGNAFDASPLDGIDYTAVITRRLYSLGPLDELRLEARKHLGVLESRVSLTKVLGRYPTLRRWDHALTFTLGHQHRTTDRAFEDFDPVSSFPEDLSFPDAFGLDAGFSEDHLLSARLDYRIGDAENEVTATVEVGGALGDYEQSLPRAFAPNERFDANRVFLTATKAAGLGPFTGVARLALGVGSDRLSPQKQFRLGASSVETAWRSDAYRVLAAVPDDPQRDAHFFALSGIGPVAYLARAPYPLDAGAGGPFMTGPSQRIAGTGLLAGSIALRLSPSRLPILYRAAHEVLSPLQFELFSGVGALASRLSNSLWDDFVADAGVGLRYDLGALGRYSDLIAQSDVLRGLHLVAKFPVWASKPERIGPSEEGFSFRWLVGVEAGL